MQQNFTSSSWDSRLIIVCLVVAEIELKKIRTLIEEASEQKSLVLPSKEVVGLITWSFVKFYGYENRSKYLVRYIILYSITPSKSFQFWYFFLVLLWLFEILTKV